VGVAVVLVAGGAVFAFRDELFGDSPPAAGDLVVENPPTLAATFADGYSELWRVDDRNVWVVDPSVVVSDTGPSTYRVEANARGVDPDTGQFLWASGGSDRDRCATGLWQGHAVCQGRDMVLIDVVTGQADDSMTSVQPDWHFVSENALYVVRETWDEADLVAGELSRYDFPGRASWTTSFTGLTSAYNDDWFGDRVGDLVVVGHGPDTLVFDAQDGRLVAGDGDCPSPRVFGANHVACQLGGDVLPGETSTLSNGATMTKTFVRGAPLAFRGPDRPAAVVAWVDGAGLARLDPASGEALWSNGLDLDWSVAEWIGHGELAGDGRAVIISETGSRALVDLETGEVMWQKAEQWVVDTTESDPVGATALGDGLLWIEGQGVLRHWATIVDLATGDGLAVTDYFGLRGSDGLFVAHHMTPEGNPDYLARLVPSGRAAAVPEGLPACPTGLSPVGWARYADGHVLVCGSSGGDFWAAARHDGEHLTPTKLTFTEDGWTVESGGGTTVAVTFDGGVVEVTGPSRGTYGAFGARFDHAVVDWSGAGEFEPCPAGGRLLSLSTWDDGWLLVCGTAADAPTFARWGGAEAGEATDVVAEPGGYCADGTGLAACAYAAPALVVLTADGSDPVQHSVSDNWFDGVGHGGSGRGRDPSFSYVRTPVDTGSDQALYLRNVLHSFALLAWDSFADALAATTQCRDVASQIETWEALAQNRRALAAHLEITPVDRIGDGTGLVAQIKAAVEVSAGSYDSYAAWAQEMRATGCAAGTSSSHHQTAVGLGQQARAAEALIVATWNSSIAPVHGVVELAEGIVVV
jgi:hypothetical protein